MMMDAEFSGSAGMAGGGAARVRRRRKEADGRWQMGDGGTPVSAEIVGVAGPGGSGDARAAGVARALREEEEEREKDAVAMMAAEEVVVELHVRQGRSLAEVARVLGVDAAGMQGLWRRAQSHLAELAPKEEADFTAMREQICAALWETVACTFPKVPLPAGKEQSLRMGADGQLELPLRFSLPPAPVLAAEPPSAPMLTVRLRALDQLAKLYDVGLARGASGAEAESDEKPYATPPEIAEAVRLRLLEMHGRRGDGTRVGR